MRITGGPAGRTTKIEIDGVEQRGVYRALLDIDVNDANRLTLFRFGGVVVERRMDVANSFKIVMNDRDRAWVVFGATVPAALRRLADDVEESEQRRSTSDTVEDPDRGPQEVVNGQDQEEPAPGEDGGTEAGSAEGR